ncbi:hypothetical protein Kpol_1072p44 [Vanderwaltozyma polyspora DSM 70294]|uniref:dynamin GTPase n=1 Tax=Vanderwaltozyma polyspora (strain ATCC 22028 / DSM 70294 / BCRC 21397 / CBS 2163 / NBRC 10782 / NRRL Y-8283 / UCD 57-17) TaxID=436907 RepID=A7TKR2_VANPO|nr:uncharacterized protein Kpol_1072p44 [Vanderwaltozyma polyspora DSM 70294]EDO17174.1 hypothetical protein Kpol_1072p44 [Vanderwaltozyma polyspora DSM 70294]
MQNHCTRIILRWRDKHVTSILFKRNYHLIKNNSYNNSRHLINNPILFQLNSKRLISSFFPRIITRVIKLPAYISGVMAATGSIIAYKIDSLKQSDYFVNLKSFLENMFQNDSITSGNTSSSSGGANSGAVVASTTILAANSSNDQEVGDDEDDDDENEIDNTNDDMLNLTKQMIEIRTILNKIDSSSNHLTLPSIVVIGSQSSGKSSVLESIVGKQFLPKGSNMVTKRPIELTLVNTPNLKETTADFPDLRIYNLKNFKEVEKILIDSNLSVSMREAISEEPIQLTIKSPNVPDLSLVDLPGYIQIEAADQPLELKSKIANLCDRYLQAPNIILAISPADVDLANSSALRASKRVDPTSSRTIGVITKLDLVDPETARDILNNKKYPLKMGYVGVITKNIDSRDGTNKKSFLAPLKKSNDGHPNDSSNNSIQSQTKQFERNYFHENKKYFSNCQVTTKKLREKLIKILEISMSNALEPTSTLIQQELDDTSYLFKVEFNDRQLTAKSYLLNNIDVFKLAVKQFQENFNRIELRSILKADLDQKVLDFLATRYWKDENLSELGNNNITDDEMLYWHKKLELASSSLTKIGVGRQATMLVTNSILKELDNILLSTQLRNHDLIKNLVTNTAVDVLNTKYYTTADQVENCIKPFKYEIDLEDRDWVISHEHSIRLLKEEFRQANEQLQKIKNVVGNRKLQQVMNYLEKNNNQIDKETLGMSKLLLERCSEALFLEKRLNVLSFRLKLLKNKCNSTSEKDKCPEIFLDAVSDKLTSTAVLFLNVELLSDFFYNFPIELDKKLNKLSEEQIELFAKEDPKISRHIELQKRKELLELALEKIDSILVFRKSYKGITKSNNL